MIKYNDYELLNHLQFCDDIYIVKLASSKVTRHTDNPCLDLRLKYL